jgi:hypothetical protein
MKWRKYEQIVDKICAWFLYQQILTRIHELSLESNPAVKEVMQYMKELCAMSTSCDTLRACTGILTQHPARGSRLYPCLTYLQEVVGRPTIDSLIHTIHTIDEYTSRPCLLPADRSEITITDNKNIEWRILRKNVRAGNQLMCFQTNQPNNIHVSIPSTWDVQKVHEIHISFDERRRHYRRYKKVMLDEEGEIGYRNDRTVVIEQDVEHPATITDRQSFNCSKIYEAFEAFDNDFHFWCCDKNFTIKSKSPCRILSK